jgi:acetylornithine/succinyldiaminopimelate/putrescine aminotransferase
MMVPQQLTTHHSPVIIKTTPRQPILQHVAQTSDAPIALEIVRAKVTKVGDVYDNEYLNLIAGFSVAKNHPAVSRVMDTKGGFLG